MDLDGPAEFCSYSNLNGTLDLFSCAGFDFDFACREWGNLRHLDRLHTVGGVFTSVATLSGHKSVLKQMVLVQEPDMERRPRFPEVLWGG